MALCRYGVFDSMSLSQEDRELVEGAKATADRLYLRDLHEVAASLRTASGTIYSGIHIEASVGFADVCGEVAAICNMVSSGEREIEAIVAVHSDGNGNYRILSPCGRCRELISDFSMEASVIVGPIEQPETVAISELLPRKTRDAAA